MVSCEKVRTSDRTADEESFLESRLGRAETAALRSIEKGMKEIDNVNNPPHYNNSPAKCDCGRRIECIDITRHYPFNIGNAIKYLWRAELKGNALEDLKKAAWYIQDEISKIEKSR